jgi:hypothetical protein
MAWNMPGKYLKIGGSTEFSPMPKLESTPIPFIAILWVVAPGGPLSLVCGAAVREPDRDALELWEILDAQYQPEPIHLTTKCPGLVF